MERYIIFGIGNYLSDIFDLIHAAGGRVDSIYQNIPEVVRDRTLSLAERLAYLPYGVEVFPSLDRFEPREGCKYVLGCTVVEKHALVGEVKRRFGVWFSPLVHPEAFLGSNVRVGEGVTIAPRVTIAPNTVLEDFVFVNRMVSIGHDARIGKYSRLGPGAVLAAFCRIGEKTSVNMGALIVDRVRVGSGSVIGAGSLVTADIPDNVVAYGSPARVVRQTG